MKTKNGSQVITHPVLTPGCRIFGPVHGVAPQARLEVIEWVSGGSLSCYRSSLLLFFASTFMSFFVMVPLPWRGAFK